ncbi:PqiC family protein [Saccharophagus degradans]|uniref:PqiC family protein n=1 Tax=Saccharophagus degradans TaxID=86304 RepID=UPI001C083D56|nr:PqiC family protein [Saccharophagus degradans]MBU2986201.1 PqiC family protein [Saccharophagus degradans]
MMNKSNSIVNVNRLYMQAAKARKVLAGLVGASAIALIAGCVSPGPQTQFFSLFPAQSATPIANKPQLSLGIGPVVLPEYAERAGVVSFTQGNGLRVAGYHAWAGSLNENIARVLAADISAALKADQIQSFPWDTRTRPDNQLRIVIEQFGGIRGENVKLVARWHQLDLKNKTDAKSGVVRLSVNLNDDAMETYIAGLNELINSFAVALAGQLDMAEG